MKWELLCDAMQSAGNADKLFEYVKKYAPRNRL